MGYAFSDFGDEFVVHDADGEEPKTGVVVNVTQGNPAVVTVAEHTPHELADGDCVALSGVEGMPALNAAEAFRIKVIDPHTFSIDADTSGMPAYVRGGYFAERKQPKTLRFAPLRAASAAPAFEVANFHDFERPHKLHAMLRALWAHEREEGGEPAPGDDAAASRIVERARRLFGADPSTFDAAWLARLVRVSWGRINPMASLFGGVVGQEVVKACTGKFTPLNQWLMLDACEVLPANPLPSSELAPRGDRYDGQIAVLGRARQDALAEKQVFVVGAGALGCEFLKNFALAGVGCGGGGGITVTDMDSIERSNLNRQFLFRPWNVGAMKSETAAAAAAAMNPSLRVRALQAKVAPETEDTFDDAFWEAQAAVVTALDNVQARLYVDSRCVYYGAPMVDSGTLGTKAHCQPVVPGHSISYGSIQDPPERSIPVCTLKTFPNQIEHTIQWARDLFEELFRQGPDEVNLYLSAPDYAAELDKQRNLKLQRAKTVRKFLVADRPTSFAGCVRLARLLFQDSFHNNIRQLLHKYPEDMVSGDPPKPFWSGARRPPTPLEFDAGDPEHMGFLVAAANLFASVYNLRGSRDEDTVREALAGVEVPPFRPDASARIAATDEEAKEMEKEAAEAEGLDEECARVLSDLPRPADVAGLRLSPEEFEKDDDSNFHMDFVAACANLRARNYKIPEADKLQTKRIAGRIIPAMATTTAVATGAVMLELYKLWQRTSVGDDPPKDDGARPTSTWPLPDGCLARFRSANFNLGVNTYGFFEPAPAERQTYKKRGEEVPFTLWDKIDLEGDMTLQQLADKMESEYGYELCSLSTRGASAVMLYSSLLNPDVMEARLEKKLSELVQEVTQEPVRVRVPRAPHRLRRPLKRFPRGAGQVPRPRGRSGAAGRGRRRRRLRHGGGPGRGGGAASPPHPHRLSGPLAP